MKQTLEYALAINIGLCVLYFATYATFLSRLRTRYPQQWDRLGKPTLFKNNTVRTTAATIAFIFKGEIGNFFSIDKSIIYTLRILFILICILLVLFTYGLAVGA